MSKQSVQGFEEAKIMDSHWVELPLEELIEKFLDFRGRTPKKLSMEWGEGDIPALSANNVQMGKINLEKGTNYGGEALYKRWMTNGDCSKGDVILTMEAPLGNVAQIPDNRRYILSQRVLLLKTKSHLVNNDFIFQRLTWENFQAELQKQATGTTAQGIQRAKLEKIPLTLPSLPEQEKIAAVLSCIDRAIEQTEAIIAKQQRIKVGLMQDLLSKGIDEQGNIRDEATHEFKDSPLSRIPKEWKVSLLNDIALKVTDGVHKTPEYVEVGIPFISVNNITANKIDFNGCSYVSKKTHNDLIKRCKPETGDLLMGKVATIGVTAVIREKEEFSIFVQIALIKPNRNKIDSEYLRYYILTDKAKKYLLDNSSGTTMKYIGIGLILKMTCLVPPIQEQQEIAKFISNVENFIEHLENKLEKLNKIKTGLAQDLLTGKVRVSALLESQA
jgi:type I restriction enzyme S subunit